MACQNPNIASLPTATQSSVPVRVGHVSSALQQSHPQYFLKVCRVKELTSHPEEAPRYIYGQEALVGLTAAVD